MHTIEELTQENVKAFTKGKSIAPLENGTTAFKAYAIGEQFIRNGVLYKAKTAIASGATLTLNTNYELADKVATQIASLKETLTNEVTTRATLGAHNLLPFPYPNMSGTYGSVAFTVASDGLVTASGTTGSGGVNMAIAGKLKLDVGSYKLKFYGSISSAVLKLRDVTAATTIGNITSSVSELSFEITNDNKDHLFDIYYNAQPSTSISINGRAAIYLATDADTTYRPYVPTNSQLLSYKDNGVLGAKNLLPFPYYQSTKTGNGITFTVNSDGSITVNGTATENTDFYLINNNGVDNFLKNGAYIISGGAGSGATSNDYKLQLTYGTNYTNIATVVNAGEEQAFTISSSNNTKISMRIRVYGGKTVSNLTFKPMIRLASDTDPTYQPYAMTNRELSEAKKITVGTAPAPTLTIKRVGKVCSFYAKYNQLDGTVDTITIGTITDSSFLPNDDYAILPLYDATAPYVPKGSIWINGDNGKVYLYKATADTNGYAMGTYIAK